MENEKGKLYARKNAMANDPNLPEVTVEDLKNMYGLNEIAVLNCNENPLGTSPKAAEAIKKAAAESYIYPDNTSSALRKKVADVYGIADDMVIFGNGADNILLMLAEAFIEEGEEMIVGSPSFFVYGTTTQIVGGKVIQIPLKDYTYDLDAIKACITDKTKIIMICNPNNPTGTIVTEAQVEEFMKDIPDHCIVVFDEAYAEFVQAKDYPNTIKYVKEDRPVIIVRTLSKVFGMAGLRIGYAVGPHYLIDVMRRVVEYYTVNRLAQAAASAAMDDHEFMEKTLMTASEGKEYLGKEFAALGIKCLPSHTNFLFVDFQRDAKEIYEKLLKKGYLIRVGGGWNLPTCARITVGTMEQNAGLVKALKEILA